MGVGLFINITKCSGFDVDICLQVFVLQVYYSVYY